MDLKTVVNHNIVGAAIRGRFTGRTRQGFTCISPSLTLQDRKDECDIQRIVQRHAETGLWGANLAPATRLPMYGDYTQNVDLLTAQNLLCKAKESFASLPSETRKEFANDPLIMLKWLENPENRKRGEELGLLEKQAEPAPLDVMVPTDTTTGSVPPSDSKDSEVNK